MMIMKYLVILYPNQQSIADKLNNTKMYQQIITKNNQCHHHSTKITNSSQSEGKDEELLDEDEQ